MERSAFAGAGIAQQLAEDTSAGTRQSAGHGRTRVSSGSHFPSSPTQAKRLTLRTTSFIEPTSGDSNASLRNVDGVKGASRTGSTCTSRYRTSSVGKIHISLFTTTFISVLCFEARSNRTVTKVVPSAKALRSCAALILGTAEGPDATPYPRARPILEASKTLQIARQGSGRLSAATPGPPRCNARCHDDPTYDRGSESNNEHLLASVEHRYPPQSFGRRGCAVEIEVSTVVAANPTERHPVASGSCTRAFTARTSIHTQVTDTRNHGRRNAAEEVCHEYRIRALNPFTSGCSLTITPHQFAIALVVFAQHDIDRIEPVAMQRRFTAIHRCQGCGESSNASQCTGRTMLKWARSNVAIRVAPRRSATAIRLASVPPSGRSM